jgi:hypothetical protein
VNPNGDWASASIPLIHAPRCFATVEELRLALLAFKRTYNQTWIIERHGYKTPAQIRDDQIGPMPMAA